ncbi:MAG: methyltransferase domain-containing protein [Methanobacteriota archaeon]
MRLLFELSGEHGGMPAEEAIAVASLAGPAAVVAREPGALVLATSASPVDLARRLALTHRIDAHVASVAVDREAVLDAVSGIDVGGRRFAVRVHRVEGRHAAVSGIRWERDAGAALAGNGRVDLSRPEVEVRILLSETAHVGTLAAEVDRGAFEDRKVSRRPFFSPVSLHPRHARALVNLSRVRDGGRLFDPFCGTGGILLEAALVGAVPVGSDLDPRMVEGSRATLAHYGFAAAHVFEADVEEAAEKVGPVDAVVMDPPYGQAASTFREPPEALYVRALRTLSRLLPEGGRLVAAFPDEAFARAPAPDLSLEAVLPMYVHRSLTRHVAVYRRL